MINGKDSIKYLKRTRRFIGAYRKIGKDELITEAEKAYFYGQYELAYHICIVIFDGEKSEKYAYKTKVRAKELYAMILYANSYDALGKFYTNTKNIAFGIWEDLDCANWDIIDSRYILGKCYLERGNYSGAIKSFKMWMEKKGYYEGLNALVEMYKASQYDTDTQYDELVMYYLTYYKNSNVKDLLLRTAKYAEEYFPQYIHSSISRQFGLPIQKVSEIHYTDDDFALPYNLRCFACSDYIRRYVRIAENPSLMGCMGFLSNHEVQDEIVAITNRAKERVLQEVIIRNHLNAENDKIDILRKEAEDNEHRYKQLMREINRYHDENIWEQRLTRWELESIRHRL